MTREAFAKAAAKPEGSSVRDFHETLLRLMPDTLRGEPAYFPDQGKCSHTVIIGNTVFKTAAQDASRTTERERYFAEGIDRERAILGHLNGKGLPVPELVHESNDPPFFGMSRLNGEPLTAEAFEKMPAADKKNLAHEIAMLSSQLVEAVSLAEAKSLGVDKPLPGVSFTTESLKRDLENSDVKKVLGGNYNFFKQASEAYIARQDEKYAGTATPFAHADLGPGNIFYDPKTNRLCGFLDFGVSHPAHPEEAFGSYYMNYSPEIVATTLKEYSRLQKQDVTLHDMRLWDAAYAVNRAGELSRERPKGWKKQARRYAASVHEKLAGKMNEKTAAPRAPKSP